MSVKVFPASVETEYPVKLSAGIQQTSESLNPTTTLSLEAATLVSLCVFCGDPLSSAKQFPGARAPRVRSSCRSGA